MRIGGFIIGGMLGGVGGLVLGIIIGVALFAGGSYLISGGTNIPYDTNHQTIANRVNVYDTTDGVQMSRKLVLMTSTAIHPYAGMDIFTAGKTYTESEWNFCCGNDIDVVMTVWGPGNDGHTYRLEFGRFAGNGVQIKAFNQTINWAQTYNHGDRIGYSDLEVQLS